VTVRYKGDHLEVAPTDAGAKQAPSVAEVAAQH
jgi:hypothetical protein